VLAVLAVLAGLAVLAVLAGLGYESPYGLDDTLALKIGDRGHLDDSPLARRKFTILRQRSVPSVSFSERAVRP
jgi:hypothetical protein